MCFEVDCVIDFWELARKMEVDSEELFYSLFPNDDYDNADSGKFVIIDCYDKICYMGEDEVREAWEEVRFFVEDMGYRFYDKVMFIF